MMFGGYRRYFYRFNRSPKKRLVAETNLANELRETIITQIKGALTLQADTGTSDEVQVHELRKAVKRSRALLRLLKPAMDETAHQKLDDMLGNSASSLTTQREATVNLRTFRQLSENAVYKLPEELMKSIQTGLEKEVEYSYSVFQNDFSPQMESSFLSLQTVKRTLDTTILLPVSYHDLSTLIKKTYQKAAKLFQEARHSLDPEIIHKWRKFNKHLHFQLKFAPLTINKITRNLIALLEELSDLLGSEHDLTVLEGYLQKNFSLSEADQEKIQSLIKEERSSLHKKAFVLGKKVYA